MVTYLGSLVQLCCGREDYCKQISLVGSACSVWAKLGLLLLTMCVLSWSTLLSSRLFYSGTVQSGPWVLCTSQVSAAQVQVLGCSTKAQTRWGLRLCPSQVGAAQTSGCLESALSPGGLCLNHLPGPSHLVSWVHCKSASSGVPCVSSGS